MSASDLRSKFIDTDIWYLFIYLLHLGFHLVAVVGRLVQYKNRKETAQKKKQYTKQYKNTEYTKQKTKIQNKKKPTWKEY